MAYTAQDVIQIITALSSFVTVLGGTYIAIKQIGIGRKVDEATKKVDEAKTVAVVTAQKLAETVELRQKQFTDLKETVIAKAEELKNAPKG